MALAPRTFSARIAALMLIAAGCSAPAQIPTVQMLEEAVGCTGPWTVVGNAHACRATGESFGLAAGGKPYGDYFWALTKTESKDSTLYGVSGSRGDWFVIVKTMDKAYEIGQRFGGGNIQFLTPDASSQGPAREVVYYVNAGDNFTAGSADITMRTGSGTVQQSVGLPLTNEGGTLGIHLEGSDAPDFAYISAQNHSSGDITCIIEINGREVARNTSTGQFHIVTCQG